MPQKGAKSSTKSPPVKKPRFERAQEVEDHMQAVEAVELPAMPRKGKLCFLPPNTRQFWSSMEMALISTDASSSHPEAYKLCLKHCEAMEVPARTFYAFQARWARMMAAESVFVCLSESESERENKLLDP